jgi:methylated-DNA-[protein]-cysteine S-methyltransferase
MNSPFVAAEPFVRADRSAEVVYHTVPSPVGELLLTSDGKALTGLYLLDWGAKPPSPEWVRDETPFEDVSSQLAEYFAGSRTEFTMPLAPIGTQWQLDVWQQLARIPFGVTVCYGDIANVLGKGPAASRAVGLANGANPISIIIPCHRVIGADGSLTGYGWGLDRKEWLLKHEGAMLF